MEIISESIGTWQPLEAAHESMGGRKRMYMEGILAQSEIVNENKRFYPRDVLAESVGNYNTDFISTSRAVGELEHPNKFMWSPDRAAVLCRSLKMEGNHAIGRLEVLDEPALPCGMMLAALINRGVKMGASTRGGALSSESKIGGQRVSRMNKYRMFAIDAVGNPSAPLAFPKAVMEGAEALVAEGIMDKSVLDRLHTTGRLDFGDRCAAMSRFLSALSHGAVR